MTRPRNPGASATDAGARPRGDDAATDPGPPPDFADEARATREHPSSGRVATARTESLPVIPFRPFAAEVRVREVDHGAASAPLDLGELVLPTADDVAARQHASARPLPKPVDNYHTIPDAKVLLNVTQPPSSSPGRPAPSATVPIRRPTERMADVPTEQLLFRERERNQRYVPTGPRLRPYPMVATTEGEADSPILRLLSLRGLIATFVAGAAVVVLLSVFVVRRAAAPVASAPAAPPQTATVAPVGSVAPPPVASPAESVSGTAAASLAAPRAPRPAPRPAKPVQPAPKRTAPPIDF